MTSFNDRIDAFEKSFAHSQDLLFKIESKAIKLFGLWMAGHLKLSTGDAEDYAKDMVMANIDRPGLDGVIAKAQGDAAQKGVQISAHMMETRLEQFMEDAKKHFMTQS